MTTATATPLRPFERKVPPVVPVGMVGLTLAITGGILVVAQIGEKAALTIPTIFVIGAILLEIVAIGMATTIRPFAWVQFGKVFRWALLAYVLQSAIIEWSFIINDVPGRPLAVLTAGLVVFATVVPVMIAFTTARYQEIAA
ncbi:MAG TPA: hypothetical protein VL068_13375 [Microthrixaceae bacterium]|nr:hypothetical protein [Microthrixaceae bacterium]